MSKNVLKTDFHTLQNYLMEIDKIPERLNRCDILLKKELLEHLDDRISSLMKAINERLMLDKNYPYPAEYLPNKEFEYWAERISRVFNYYELIRLKNFIQDSIEVKTQNNKYEHLFNKNGFTLFNYLDENFRNEKGLTVKYTIIFYFLESKGKIKCTASKYLDFVREHCKKQLDSKELKFSRVAFNDYSTNPKYLKNEQRLSRLYKEFQ